MKEEILQTSLNQFLKFGIREMSIQKLIEPLGISTKTVYKYFKNKEELLAEALTLLDKQNVKQWQYLQSIDNPVALFAGIWNIAIETEYNVNKVFYHDLHHYYPELHKKNEARLSKRYKKKFIQIIRDGKESGFFHDSILPEVVFESVSILYKAITREGQFQTFRVSSDEIIFNTIYIYIRGFCSKKGIECLEGYVATLRRSEKHAARDKESISHG